MIEALQEVFSQLWFVLSEMSPYLLFGFLIAGLLSVLISAEKVQRHLGGRSILPVIKASLFGVPLPLCSCGVIPVAASLRRSGASRGATTSFLLSTPQTGVDSILVTYSLLGPVFAVFRPLAALVTGLVGGSIVSALEPASDPMAGKDELSDERGCQGDSCGLSDQGDEKPGRAYRALHYGFVTLPRDIARALIVGLVIAGVISAVVPEDFFAEHLGTGIVPMLVMMGVGLPVYVCATASVPVAAALIMTGLTPGAALVFLMTGPATNAATVATVWRIMGRKTAVIYLATTAIAALAAGLSLDYIFKASGAVAHPAAHQMLPGPLKTASAVILLAVLAYALIKKRPVEEIEVEKGQGGTVILNVKGMHCTHCQNAVKSALSGIRGVERVEVNLERGKAYVSGKELEVGSLCDAVRQLGYEAEVSGDPAIAACATGR